MDELTNRNFQALAEGLKEQRSANSMQDAKIKGLESTIAQLQAQVLIMQGQVAQTMARTMGTGATVI